MKTAPILICLHDQTAKHMSKANIPRTKQINSFRGSTTVLQQPTKRSILHNVDQKNSADQQVKAILCHFLKKQKLGVIGSDVAAVDSCKSAVQRVVQLLLFVRKHLGSLRINNESILRNNEVLSQLQFCVSTSIHEIGSRPRSTTVDALTQFLESNKKESKSNKRCWPGTFFKKKKDDPSTHVGKPVFDLEDSVNTLVLRTRQRLNDQASRTAIRTASESGRTAPSVVNTGYSIRRTNRHVSFFSIPFAICIYYY